MKSREVAGLVRPKDQTRGSERPDSGEPVASLANDVTSPSYSKPVASPAHDGT
jgi:hypothetical protein